MDEFEVTAETAEFLERSELVEQLQADAETLHSFPAVIDGLVRHFNEIDGGYSEDSEYHVINLISDDESSVLRLSDEQADTTDYELHLEDKVWTLDVVDSYIFRNGRSTLTIVVSGYAGHDYTFVEQLTDGEIEKEWVSEDV